MHISSALAGERGVVQGGRRLHDRKNVTKIRYHGRLTNIEIVAKHICEDIANIELVDTEAETYSALLQHMLSVTVSDMIATAIKTYGEDEGGLCYPECHPFKFGEDYDPTCKGKAPYWDAFFRSLPKEILTLYKDELLSISPMAIQYIDTDEPNPDDPDLDWYEAAVTHHPDALKYIPESKRSKNVILAAIRRGGRAIRHIENPTIEEQDAALKQIPVALFKIIKSPAPEIVLKALMQAQLWTNDLQYVLSSLERITPSEIAALCHNEEEAFIDPSLPSDIQTTDTTKELVQLQRLLMTRRVKKVHQIVIDHQKEQGDTPLLQEVSIPRKHNPRLAFRTGFWKDLLFSEIEPDGFAFMDCISKMKTLMIWTGPGKGDYTTVMPDQNPVPGTLGAHGVTGAEFYAEYYQREDATITDYLDIGHAVHIAETLTYGEAGYIYQLYLSTLFLGCANIVEDVVSQPNLPYKQAQKIMERIRKNKERVREEYYFEAELSESGLAAIYRDKELHECLSPLYEYGMECVLRLPGTSGYTYISCRARGSNLCENIWLNERERPLRKLLTELMLSACTQVTYNLFGAVKRCKEVPFSHGDRLSAILDSMERNPFHVLAGEFNGPGIAPGKFTLAATIGSAAFYDDLYDPELALSSHYFLSALYLIAVHVTGLCGVSDDEVDVLVNCAAQYWHLLNIRSPLP